MKKTKKCNACGEEKPLTAFWVDRRVKKGGVYACCKPCETQRQKEWMIKKYGSYEEGVRVRWLKHKYNLTVEEYNNLLESQQDRCAICSTDDRTGGPGNYFPVDHCHDTGEVRGILCHTCNLAVGCLKDKIEIAERLVLYLKGKLK